MTSGAVDLAGTRLIIWRHGNTDWNAGNRFQGQLDIPLNELGRAQAQSAAAVLAELHPDAIVTSDLQRAAHTAAALAERTGLTAHRDARLRERHFGAWEGLTREEIQERSPAGFEAWRLGQPLVADGIERAEDLLKRAHEGLVAAAERAPGGTVVVATHGGTARWAIAAMLGWPEEVIAGIGVLGNCHWSELRFYPRTGWRLTAHNRFA
ncbi:putative phosphoglycerate mutase [Allocatelliglobosispora scoriae]|uniref:Putative phosphoglycerate mutase n=1 Tax=Allocatelliglobosispora scoriae TaxID=643052 RepID=A0A841BRG7_9ACTN|nr:histidine phosphatase family protein [Allocatelliglobosispora scoriae]MBB5869789.1 putative phosphoglycerate mutase [Allocatelliglobosispora scoriae]